jgi:aerobic carbon-monoxide dehydrogenase medium subunit
MKAPSFQYARPRTLAEACALLAADEEAQVLAGGQSLMATLNMRLARPSLLVDINRVEDFIGIEPLDDGGFRVGPLVRHADIERSPIVAERAPLIARAMEHVAHMAIRNRGTHCGSLALADPAAEMPACAVTLNATLTLANSEGRREIAAGDYFQGPYETPREPGDILVEVRYPAPAPDMRIGFGEIAVRHGDFPQVGIAATARVSSGIVRDLRLVTFGCEPCARLSAVAGEIAEGQTLDEALIGQVADAVAADIEPMDSDAVRRLQTATLVRRVLGELL